MSPAPGRAGPPGLGGRAQLLLLAALCACTFVVNAGALGANIMESRNLTTAREMLEKGNWLLPTMNGEPRLEKPPLPTWATAVAMAAFGEEDLGGLRLPAALAGALLVAFAWLLARELTDDALAPFLAAGTAATSFYVFFMARDITWDIFCHAFMLGAIWQLHRGLARPAGRLASFAAAGLLMGLSFLSKGPVSFFSLLLPYLVARTLSSGAAPYRAAWRPLLLTVVVALAASAAWPAYAWLTRPEASAHVAQKESTAWINRNVRPFWQYWSFTAQSGVWAVLATAALVFPYARRRVARLGDYRLLAAWIWTGVLLLSLFPEKKERYLLPVLVPMALLTALYVRSLADAFRAGAETRADRAIVRANAWLMAAVAAAVPIALWLALRARGASPGWPLLAAVAAVFWALAALLGHAGLRGRPLAMWGGMVGMVAAACVLVLGQVPAIITRNPGYRPYGELDHRADLAGVPFFRAGDVTGKFIEVIWASGREIHAWDPRERPDPPVAPPLLLMTSEPPDRVLAPELARRFRVEDLGVYDGAVDARWGGGALRNHVVVLRPR